MLWKQHLHCCSHHRHLHMQNFIKLLKSQKFQELEANQFSSKPKPRQLQVCHQHLRDTACHACAILCPWEEYLYLIIIASTLNQAITVALRKTMCLAAETLQGCADGHPKGHLLREKKTASISGRNYCPSFWEMHTQCCLHAEHDAFVLWSFVGRRICHRSRFASLAF